MPQMFRLSRQTISWERRLTAHPARSNPQELPDATYATWLRLWELADDPGEAGYVTDRAYIIADEVLNFDTLRRGAEAVMMETPGVCIKYANSPDGKIWFDRGTGISVEEIDLRTVQREDVPAAYSKHARSRRNQGFNLQSGPLLGLDILRFQSFTLLHWWRFHLYLAGRADHAVTSLLLDAAQKKAVPPWNWQLDRWDTCRKQSSRRLMPTEQSRRHVGRVLELIDQSPGLTRLSTPGVAPTPLSASGRAQYSLDGTSQALDAAAWSLRVTPYVIHLAAYCLLVGALIDSSQIVLATSFSSVDGVIGPDDIGNWGYDGYVCIGWHTARTFSDLVRLVMREVKVAESNIVTHREFTRQLGVTTSDLEIAHSFAESAPIAMDDAHELLLPASPSLRVPNAITFDGRVGNLDDQRLSKWRWHGAPNLEVPQDRTVGVMHANTALYSPHIIANMAENMSTILRRILLDPTASCSHLVKTIQKDAI